MNESEMAMAVMQRTKDGRTEGEEIDFNLEVPYNNYGDRGYVDLHIKIEAPDASHTHHSLYELKSDYALSQVTGANEILRQFNKMRENFGPAKDIKASKRRRCGVTHFLMFEPSEKCVRHVLKNLEHYRTIPYQAEYYEPASRVGFVLPAEGRMSGRVGIVNSQIDRDIWEELVEQRYPELWDAYQAVDEVYERV